MSWSLHQLIYTILKLHITECINLLVSRDKNHVRQFLFRRPHAIQFISNKRASALTLVQGEHYDSFALASPTNISIAAAL